MKHLKLLILIAWLTVAYTTKAQIVVEAGNAESLLNAIERANLQNADTLSERLFILIPDGVYDLGERVLTSISGHNIALVGQSMEGTIIVNAPKVENEGISTTATLLNRGHHTYVQDLTLKNALDYYHSGAAGRAVCWQDKGDSTIHTIVTTSMATRTSRTPRFMVRSTLSVVPVMCSLIIACW